MIFSRKTDDIAGRLTKLTTDLDALQDETSLLNGVALEKADVACRNLEQAVALLKDALAVAHAKQEALSSKEWDAIVRLPLWRHATDPARFTQILNGTQVGGGVRLFHDCLRSEIALSQTAQTAQNTDAPFCIKLAVAAFEGSFLSLAIDVPTIVTRQLTSTHVMRATLNLVLEKQSDFCIRLNVQFGPNIEQIGYTLTGADGATSVEFDLSYVTALAGHVIDKMWIDVMVEAPAQNQIVLRDMTIAHRRRAEI